MRVSAAALGLSLIAAGCGGGVLVATDAFSDPVISEKARGPFANGAPMEVRGAPPNGAGPAEVVAAIRVPPHSGGGVGRLHDAPGEGRRFVISFVGGGPETLCGAPGSSAQTGRSATAVLCVGPDPASGATLRSIAGTGPGDPTFEAEMAYLMRETMPRLRAAFRRSLGGGA